CEGRGNFMSLPRPPPRSTLFPYTTLFRSAAQFGAEGKILAGGHSLVPMMKLRLATPKHVIDIGRIADLSYIREDDGKILIGAMRSEEHTSELQSLAYLVCRLLLEKKKKSE